MVLQSVPTIIEAAAVGFPTPGGGPEQLHLFVVLAAPQPQPGHTAQPGAGSPPAQLSPSELQQLHQACQEAIKKQLNPLFKVQRVVPIGSLPRTASNKVMRRLLRSEAAPANSKL